VPEITVVVIIWNREVKKIFNEELYKFYSSLIIVSVTESKRRK
jgi:hypothetical protein